GCAGPTRRRGAPGIGWGGLPAGMLLAAAREPLGTAGSSIPSLDASAAAAPESASSEPSIPDYAGYVNDVAAVMDEPSRAKLEAFLDQLQKKTGAQFAVLTIKSTAPLTPSEYKVQVFQQWKIGEQGKDNGLLMLVALDEHEVRFETGYGLEGVLPDGLESRIFREQMAPHFRQGDNAGGITAGVLACSARIAADHNATLYWSATHL